jgi:hypothetical protein
MGERNRGENIVNDTATNSQRSKKEKKEQKKYSVMKNRGRCYTIC